MSESQFKKGNIVYHKANNLRMVIIGTKENESFCRYVDYNGKFVGEWYYNIEISREPIPTSGSDEAKVIYSLPLRSQ